ncbi:MAG: SPOR domain-containing protein, partial [Alphaproteobacteria bacterium]|nr:SPOR domain-containing protein [Alphaproteobacteria bacterium]
PPPRADKPRQESPPPPAQAPQRQDPPQQARPVPAVLAQPLERSMRSEPVRDTRIYVQAGSFSRFDNANRLTALLTGLGQARIMQAVVNGKDMYRVRLGPFETVDVADRALDSVIRAGHTEARIIVD